MKVRKWVRLLHRDIGYLSVGLIIIYSVSGIAVNHINDWNPNYIVENETVYIEPVNDSTATNEFIAEYVGGKLNISDSLNSFFRNGPSSIQLFYERKTIDADIATGEVNIETVKDRAVFRHTNFLHLNVPKKVWTYVADVFAAALIFLAISGMFMIRNKNGIKGRGKYLVGIGVLIPIVFLIIYF